MRIAFDARLIDHPGIGKYIKNLLKAMMAQNNGSEIILYGDPRKLCEFKGAVIREYTVPVYGWKELFFSPIINEDADVVHVPHFNVPFHNIRNLVITIHDLIYLKLADSAPLLKRLAAKPVIANAVGRADKIIAVSENTKNDIIEYFPGTKNKIEVIYEAADPIFKKKYNADELDWIRQKYALPRDILLFVGSLRKHKNIERLIDAYVSLKPKGLLHKLVIVGRQKAGENKLINKINSAGASYLGEVPIEDLVALYNAASLLVLPSLYEGFGLPILEAMACRVPVATSLASSLPEVAGDAAIYFNPNDTLSIAQSIQKVIIDKDRSAELVENGKKRLENFSWEKTAQQTLDIYKKLVKNA